MAKGKVEKSSGESVKKGSLTVRLGGEDRSLKIGFLSVEVFVNLQLKSVGSGNIKALTDIVYSTHYCHCVVKEVQCPSYEEVSEWVDDLLLDGSKEIEAVAIWFNTHPIVRKILKLDKAA